MAGIGSPSEVRAKGCNADPLGADPYALLEPFVRLLVLFGLPAPNRLNLLP
jgi:hypothetical protein